MAAPSLNRAHQKDIRDKIQTIQLVKRLQDYVLGGTDPKTGALIEIDAGRMKAIEILLRKSLPDLSSVTVSGDPESPVHVTHGVASAKLAAFLDGIAERSAEAGRADG